MLHPISASPSPFLKGTLQKNPFTGLLAIPFHSLLVCLYSCWWNHCIVHCHCCTECKVKNKQISSQPFILYDIISSSCTLYKLLHWVWTVTACPWHFFPALCAILFTGEQTTPYHCCYTSLSELCVLQVNTISSVLLYPLSLLCPSVLPSYIHGQIVAWTFYTGYIRKCAWYYLPWGWGNTIL